MPAVKGALTALGALNAPFTAWLRAALALHFR